MNDYLILSGEACELRAKPGRRLSIEDGSIVAIDHSGAMEAHALHPAELVALILEWQAGRQRAAEIQRRRSSLSAVEGGKQ